MTNIRLFPGAHGSLFSHARAVLTFILNTAIPGFLARNPNPISKRKAAKLSGNVGNVAAERVFRLKQNLSIARWNIFSCFWTCLEAGKDWKKNSGWLKNRPES